MAHKDKDLEKIYQDIFADAVEYMRDHEVQAVAATYMAIAMRLYKTHLDDEEYKSMIERIFLTTEIRPRIISLPTYLLGFLVFVFRWLPGFRDITLEMVLRVNQDLCYNHQKAIDTFDWAPRPFEP